MKRKLILFVLLWAPVLLFAQNKQIDQSERKLTILYTNDLHAHFESQRLPHISDTRNVGGFANIATLVKNEKKANANTVYFDAGDYFSGPYISTLTKGEAVIDVMNHLSLDAACIGNHEFDHSWQNVSEQMAKAKFPILNGNIFIKNTERLLWNHPYKIIIKNGIRLGVIGLHGKFAFYDTIADEMIQGVEARDEEIYLKKYIEELKGKTDLIILLIHQGIPGRQSSQGSTDVSRNLQKDIELASKVEGLDIIVTGHAHQGTPEALISNGTLIVSTNALGSEVGKLEIVYDKKTDRIISHSNKLIQVFDDEIEDDKATMAAINKWKKKSEQIAREKTGTVSGALTRSYGEESTLGNLVTDAMLAAHPGYEIALLNSGGLRQDIPSGTVTFGNIISAYPFPNTIVKLQLKGSEIKELFEHAASLTNGILQVSKGVNFIYNENHPTGSRVVSIKIKDELINDDKLYKVVTTNFLADGGDGYLSFKKAVERKNTPDLVFEAIRHYLKSDLEYQPLLEGRIIKILD
jgi:5'-nucleotidase / UDP-sugar diphosphatase